MMWIGLRGNVLGDKVRHFVTWLRFAGIGFVLTDEAGFAGFALVSRRFGRAIGNRFRLDGGKLSVPVCGVPWFV